MSRVFMISDLHINHKNMVKKRGFAKPDDMWQLIKYNWNQTVHKKDKVYILGDLTMETADYSWLDELNGRKVVVLGNHDLEKHSRELLNYVDNVVGCMKYKKFILTHIPIHESEVDRFKGNIHGHIHEKILVDTRYFNVCCEVVDYRPVLFEDILKEYDVDKALEKLV